MPHEQDRSRWRTPIRAADPPAPARDGGAPATCVADIPKLKPAEFEEIRTFAKQRFGLDLKKGKEDLVSARLARGMRQGRFRSFREYLNNVESDSTGKALVALINALTTNHTSFYREPHHFEFLASEILPKFRPGSGLRIWSAASSTGEEAYSIACCVAQHWNGSAGRIPAGADVRGLRILATDISTRVLETAAAALYPPTSLAPAPTCWAHSFFQRSDREGYLKLRPELASAVEFRRMNLIEAFPFQEKFHVIFCRNVMIYFDKATQEGLVRRLAERLEPGGHLFVGHSESLAGVSHPLTYLRPAIYRNDSGKRGLLK
jgi:chemotaxis protein methyltransferase CheR